MKRSRLKLFDRDALLGVRYIEPNGNGTGTGLDHRRNGGDGVGAQYAERTWFQLSSEDRSYRPYKYANKSVDDWLVVALRLQGWSP